jgi:PAS domain S-box-containing protein
VRPPQEEVPTPGKTDAPAAARLPGINENALYRSLFVAYPDSMLLVGPQGRIVLANPAAAELLGYSIDELAGMGIDALVPDSIRPRHAAYREAYGHAPRARPMGTQMDLVARRKDGSEVMVEIALSPLQVDDQLFVVAAIRDIATYPRVKQALQRARYSDCLAQFGRLAVDARDPQVLVEQVPRLAAEALQVELVSVLLLDNSALEFQVAAGVGLVRGEELGARLANRTDTLPGFVLAQSQAVVVPDFAGERRLQMPRAYLDAGLTSGLAVPLSDRGRVVGVICAAARAPRWPGEEETRFLGSLANLLATTLQRAQSEEALSHSQRLESVGQLTGGIAHDFNNLLTVIQGNLQILEETPGVAQDAFARQMVDDATRAAKRGAQLTSKLLAFSRRQVLQPTAVDLGAMLRSLANMLRRTLDQRIQIDVLADCAPVLADPGQLESALLNIAINARDAMVEGGTLRFQASACRHLPEKIRTELGGADPERFVAIAVSDTGAGMSEEVEERAFEPFFTTKEAGRGTGLGLSTVYGFVKQSKGAVGLASELGVGTTLTLYLPRVPEYSEISEIRPESTRLQAVPSGLRVLLVEDAADVRVTIATLLKSLGCQVVAAASGEQALGLLEPDAAFDLLLTDIALGRGMRGTAVAASAQQRLPGLGILLMSGFSAELLEADRDSPSEWQLLQKPCSREELARAIAQVLAERGTTEGPARPVSGSGRQSS